MKETKALKMAAVFALQGHAKPMLRPNIPDIYRCKSALRHERKNDGDLDYECETTAGQRHRLSFTMQPLLTQLVMRRNIGDEYRLPTIIAVSPVTKYLSPVNPMFVRLITTTLTDIGHKKILHMLFGCL